MLSANVIIRWYCAVLITISVESSRFVASSVNSTATPSIVVKDQDMFRDPAPFSETVTLKGAEGGPIVT